MGVLEHARSLLLLLAAPGSGALLDIAEEDVSRLSGLAEAFSAPEIVRILDLVARAVTDMRTAPDHRLLLEIALVRAAAPVTDPSATGLLGRIERLERRLGIHEPEEEPPPPAPESSPAPPPTAPPPSRPAPAPTPPEPQPTVAQPVPVQTEPDAADHVGLTHIKDAWPAALKEVVRGNRLVGAYLTPSRPLRLENGTLLVEVQADYHKEHMEDDKNQEVLGRALHLALGVSPRLQFVARGSAPPAPIPEAAEADEATSEAPDPVRLLKEGLSAEVVEERTVES
jgi:hypothetical protein